MRIVYEEIKMYDTLYPLDSFFDWMNENALCWLHGVSAFVNYMFRGTFE